MTAVRSDEGGIQLRFHRTGIEGKLLGFIEDAGQSVNNEAWFNFDRLLFETDSAVLRPESREQLRNIGEILKAYPNVQVKVGGYTDSPAIPNSSAVARSSQQRQAGVDRPWHRRRPHNRRGLRPGTCRGRTTPRKLAGHKTGKWPCG